ncbi:MAG: DMT family transporter [Alphaproteobacteria bacterium]|nr:MAG: DMT family transporter [Alphaproteobacteria bacterium]
MKNQIISPKFIATLFSILWSLIYTINVTITKFIDCDLDNTVIVFWRSFFGLLLFLPVIINKGPVVFKTQHPWQHFVRAFFLTAAIWFTYKSYRFLPLTFATSIGFTSPLIMALLSIFILGEKVSPQRWVIILIGYVGVLVIVRPGIIAVNKYVIMAILANITAGLSLILVRYLSSHDKTSTILFYAHLGTFVFASILVIYDWQPIATGEVHKIAVMSLCGLTAQYLYATAVKYAEASYVSPFEYLRIIFAVPLAVIFFNETIDLWVIGGTTIIIASTWVLSRMSQVKGAV